VSVADVVKDADHLYQPPPEAACEVDTFPIYLSVLDGVECLVTVHLQFYRERLVHFSIELRVGSAVIARIDTSHGQIHRHDFDRRQVQRRTVYETIEKSRAWSQIETAYDRLYPELAEPGKAAVIVERWRRT
jgi:hypothetical protein